MGNLISKNKQITQNTLRRSFLKIRQLEEAIKNETNQEEKTEFEKELKKLEKNHQTMLNQYNKQNPAISL